MSEPVEEAKVETLPETPETLVKKLENIIEVVKKDVNEAQQEQLSGTKRKEVSSSSSSSSSSLSSSSSPSWSPWPEKGVVSIETAPTKEMTGVDPIIARLCQSISGQSYNVEKKSDFLFSDFETDLFQPEVIICEMHKGFEHVTPTFVVVVVGTTMILAWKGSETFMDWDTNFGFHVVASSRWKPLAKTIKVHAGFLADAENDLVVHEDKIIDLLADKHRGIKEVICTGHSLGGGIAQVCHLVLEAQLSMVDKSPWKKLENQIVVRTVAFEAPMSVVFDPNKPRFPFGGLSDDDKKENELGKEFLKKCGTNMCCTVYNMDVVPRLYSQVGFTLELIENLVLNDTSHDGAAKRLAKRLVSALGGIIVLSKAGGNLLPLVKCLLRYEHLGKIIYYDGEQGTDANPVVYDNVDELANQVKYVSVPRNKLLDRCFSEHDALVQPWKGH